MNEQFQTVFETSGKHNLRTVSHFAFNPTTDELITHDVQGTALWKFEVDSKQPIGSLQTYSHYR